MLQFVGSYRFASYTYFCDFDYLLLLVQFLTGTVLILCVVLLLLAFYLRFAIAITRSNSCLVGKTAIVTGANSGELFQVLEEIITF
jgi:hypothetical protein